MPYLIAVEGLDFTGKSTQVKMLLDAIPDMKATAIKFPIYGTPVGKLIRNYLDNQSNSQFPEMTLDKTDPRFLSMMYAANRSEGISLLRTGESTVIIDRYIASNATNIALIKDPEQQDELIKDLINYELTYNRIPRPDVTIFLSFYDSKNYNARRKAGIDERGVCDVLESYTDLNDERSAIMERMIKLSSDVMHKIYIDNYDGSMKTKLEIHNEILAVVYP